MKIFELNEKMRIECDWKRTRSGFKHVARLYIDGELRNEAKMNYLNRTWESYEYESVIERLIDASGNISPRMKPHFKAICSGKAKAETDGMFKSIAMVARLGEIIGNDKKESNDWKIRIIKAGLGDGIIMPPDWDSLTEKEKENRLNKVINELNK